MKSLYQYGSSRFCFPIDFISNKSANSYLSPTSGFSQNLASVAMDLDFDVLYCPIHTGEFDLIPFNFPIAFFKKLGLLPWNVFFRLSAFLCCLNKFALFASPDFPPRKILYPGRCSKSLGFGLSVLAFPFHFLRKTSPSQFSGLTLEKFRAAAGAS